MYLILPTKHHHASDTSDIAKEVCEKWEKPADYAFMDESEHVLANIPDTWKKYPATIPGMAAIIDMEYKEFKDANTVESMSHELVHLASACLHLWRKLNNVEL